MEPLQQIPMEGWAAALLGLVVLVLLLWAGMRRASGTRYAGRGHRPGLPEAPEGWARLQPENGDGLPWVVQGRAGPQARYYRVKLSDGEVVALGHRPWQPWVDLFLRRPLPGEAPGAGSGPYELYSYHLVEKRWSYGAEPPGHRELEAVIQAGFGVEGTQEGRR